MWSRGKVAFGFFSQLTDIARYHAAVLYAKNDYIVSDPHNVKTQQFIYAYYFAILCSITVYCTPTTPFHTVKEVRGKVSFDSQNDKYASQ
jgi:hypothetical protein